jgi:hypothetical protein
VDGFVGIIRHPSGNWLVPYWQRVSLSCFAEFVRKDVDDAGWEIRDILSRTSFERLAFRNVKQQ